MSTLWLQLCTKLREKKEEKKQEIKKKEKFLLNNYIFI